MHSGGAERVAATLANAWVARGDEVTLVPTFSGRGSCFYNLSDKVNVVFLADLVRNKKKSLFNRIQRLFALRTIFSQQRPDVVISFLHGVNVATLVSSIGLSIPVIVCERTDPFVDPRSLFWKLAVRFSYPFADRLIVQTEAVRKKTLLAFPRLTQVRVVSNPLPENVQRIERQLRVGQRRRLIAMGRLSEEKQFSLLISVFLAMASRWREWDLVIYGEGPLQRELEQQIVNTGLSGRVLLAGSTTTPWKELVQSDVFVMTSRFEGFPNALLEAMGLGLPCVVFDCPSGPREMTLDGQDAILVPPNDLTVLEQALETMMLDAGLRLALGNRARRSVLMRYSLARILERWDEIFAEIGARAGSSGGMERHGIDTVLTMNQIPEHGGTVNQHMTEKGWR
jgi:glycosyltransferase involved in cell wall biosynthesis